MNNDECADCGAHAVRVSDGLECAAHCGWKSAKAVSHWRLKAGVEETMCGLETKGLLAMTLISDWATCEKCKIAAFGYQMGRADERTFTTPTLSARAFSGLQQSPFRAGTAILGATETGQRVTVDNVHYLPPGSVVRLDDGDGILIYLHDDLWYYRSGVAWCYDYLEHLKRYLPGVLCHHP